MYQDIFDELNITDPELQSNLVSFVENKDNTFCPEFISALNEDKNLQTFIERVFAQKFKPLQDLVSKDEKI